VQDSACLLDEPRPWSVFALEKGDTQRLCVQAERQQDLNRVVRVEENLCF